MKYMSHLKDIEKEEQHQEMHLLLNNNINSLKQLNHLDLKLLMKKMLKEKMLMLMVMDQWEQCYILVQQYLKSLLKLI